MWEELYLFSGCASNACGNIDIADLSAESKICVGDEMGKEIKVFAKEMVAALLRRRVDRSTVPPGIVLIQTFPARIKHFIGNLYKDEMLYEKCRHTPFS